MNSPDVRPLLSIVIPTKNRYETLLSTVKAMLENIPDPRLEIVIEDNSDDPGQALEFLAEFDVSRIRYAHCSKLRSVVENTELALSRASGQYITFIGDDDFVLPDILEHVQRFSDQGIEAVSYPPAYYWWDTINFQVPSRYHQPRAFWYPVDTSANEVSIDTARELHLAMAQGAVGLFKLPRVYHGVVSGAVLAKVKEETGKYVNGASPDMALAVGVAHVIRSHTWFGQPLTVYGASKNSGGGYTASHTHFGNIADQPHLPQSTKDNWSEHLPPIWSEHTIYPQTVMEVLRAFRKPQNLNLFTFFASILVNEPHLQKFVLPFVWRYLSNHPKHILAFFAALAKKFLGRLIRNFRSQVSGLPFELNFFNSPDECIKHMAKKRKTYSE
jgi:glycosyltransferase involved in cell wall biosynthesis